MDSDPANLEIDNIVDDIIVLDDNPQLDDALILRLEYDLATQTHRYETIARRYGLAGELELWKYLKAHPSIVAEAKRLRALFQSDEAIEQRVRMRFLVATETLIPPMQHLVADPRTPIAQRIDGFKQIQRGAGVDGAPPKDAKGNPMGPGTAFVLNINFTNGQSTRIAATTVVDPDEIPPPALDESSALENVTDAVSEEPDEDV